MTDPWYSSHTITPVIMWLPTGAWQSAGTWLHHPSHVVTICKLQVISVSASTLPKPAVGTPSFAMLALALHLTGHLHTIPPHLVAAQWPAYKPPRSCDPCLIMAIGVSGLSLLNDVVTCHHALQMPSLSSENSGPNYHCEPVQNGQFNAYSLNS